MHSLGFDLPLAKALRLTLHYSNKKILHFDHVNPEYPVYDTIHDGAYHPLRGGFSMVDVSTVVAIVSVPKEDGVRNMSSRAFPGRAVRCWHALGCRAIDLRKTALKKGGVIYTVLYGTPKSTLLTV